MKTKSFTLTASFPFPSKSIFTAFTNAQQIKAWSGLRGRVQPKLLEKWNCSIAG